METLLHKLGNHSETKTVAGLADAVHIAKESVKIPAVPVHEKRAKCLTVFQLALNASKPKLSLIALEGFQIMLRESTFLSDASARKPEDALGIQMLGCLEKLPEWDKQIQCQLITVIVQLISSNEVAVSLNNIYDALQICTKTYNSEDISVKLAVRAGITQMLNSFCSNRHAKVFQHSNPSQGEMAVLMDMTALLSEVYRRLSAADSADDLQLALDSVYSVLSAQPDTFHKHPPLLNIFTSELVPCLLCLLHATDEKPPPTKSLLSRSPTIPLKVHVFSSPESTRSFYQVVEQMIRLLARVPDAEPLTLELFRSSLLIPSTGRRFEALRLLKRLFATPPRFTEFLDLCAREPQFWPVALSCLEECAKSGNLDAAVEAIRALHSLFDGLRSQLTPSSCENFSTIVHEILRTAADARGPKQSTASASKIHIAKRRRSNVETQNSARQFVSHLIEMANQWTALTDTAEVDNRIQQFAAEMELTDEEPADSSKKSLLNTDAAYFAAYAALSFGLRFGDDDADRAAFFSQITSTGYLVCANESWLSDVYNELLGVRMFADTVAVEKTALGSVIEDYDGFHKRMVTSFRDDDENKENAEPKVEENADERYQYLEDWLRNLLATSWSAVLSILTKFTLKLNKKGSSDKTQNDGVEATFDATASLLRLLIKLRLGAEITWIFERIGEEICLLEELREFVVQNVGLETKKPWRINRIDALAVGLVLDSCVECATLAPTCWKYTIRTIEYIGELEKYSFRLTKTANIAYDPNELSLNDLLGKVSQNELSLATVGRVLDELMLKIDGLMEEAPRRLNLPTLCSLLSLFCTADEDCIRNLESAGPSPPSRNALDVFVAACSLSRISRLVAASASRRPLVHRMRIWAAVREHLIAAAATHFPTEITRLSVGAVYDCVRSLLVAEELSGSAFHHSLLSAYQDILCGNVCAEETQENVVSNLAALIIEAPHQIGSGWRPLFGALKAIRISPAPTEAEGSLYFHRTEFSADPEAETPKSTLSGANLAVLDVFRKYLAIGDAGVLIPTVGDFVHCLVHYLQAADTQSGSSDGRRDAEIGEIVFAFVPDLQKLLEKFFVAASAEDNQIPSPAALVRRIRQRATVGEAVDESPLDGRLSDVADLATLLLEDESFGTRIGCLGTKPPLSETVGTPPWNDWTDPQLAVGELLLALVDEATALLATCSRGVLSRILVGVADMVGRIRDSDFGFAFGVWAICGGVLPVLQKWSHREPTGFVPSSRIPQSSRNLKQSTTVFTELVADYIRAAPADSWTEKLVADTMVLFNDLLSSSSPFIAGTGVACLRHLVTSIGVELTPLNWSLVTRAVWRSTSLSLAPIRKLVSKFVPNSVDLNGDIGEVHVVVKEDSQTVDYAELRLMAHQIFQIDTDTAANVANRRRTSVDSDGDSVARPQFAYIFVFQPKPGQTNPKTERAVTMDEIVASLLSAQALLQLLSQLLIGVTASVASPAPSSVSFSRSLSLNERPLSAQLTKPQLGALVACLDATASVAAEFDSRPALKYLLQKLMGAEQPANLYKLAVASQSLKLQTIYELAKEVKPTKEDIIKVVKKQGTANTNLTFIRLIDTLVERTFDSLEELDAEVVSAARSAAPCRDRIDVESAFRLSEEFEGAEEGTPVDVGTPQSVTSPRATRPNPFLSRMSVKPSRTSTDSADGMQLGQLTDLDLRLVAQSEIVAILIERVIAEDPQIFRVFLPLFLPKVRKLMRICPAKRARFACSEFLSRLDQEWEISG